MEANLIKLCNAGFGMRGKCGDFGAKKCESLYLADKGKKPSGCKCTDSPNNNYVCDCK